MAFNARLLSRPSYIPSREWVMLGTRNIPIMDSCIKRNIGPNDIPAHCPSERMAKLKTCTVGINPSQLALRADIIDFISQAIHEKGIRMVPSILFEY